MLRGGFRSQPVVNEAFAANKGKALAFALLQGPGLNEKETRLNLENIIIRIAGENAINVIGKKEGISNPFLTDPSIKRAIFKPLPPSQSWSDYGLHYNYEKEKKAEGCIYIFMHTETKNFYIGETTDFVKSNVLKRHRAAVAQSQALALQKQQIKGSNSVLRMVEDVITHGVNFVYSTIEFTGGMSTMERKKGEEELRFEAFQRYGNRLYNPPVPKVAVNVKKRTEASKALSREAAVAQRKNEIRKHKSQKPFPCIIEGIWYNTMAEAGRALGITAKGTIKKRLLSPKFPNYIWLKDPSKKQIPDTPEIKEKVKIFFLSLEN